MAPLVSLREWNRADRRASNAWPLDHEPLSWLFASIARPAQPGRRASWAIVADGELAGRLSLREFDQAAGSARLGLYVRADRRGRGIGRAALAALGALWFRELGGRALLLDVWAANRRAVTLYAAAGYRQIGASWEAIPWHVDLEWRRDPDLRPAPPQARLLEMRLCAQEWRHGQSGG